MLARLFFPLETVVELREAAIVSRSIQATDGHRAEKMRFLSFGACVGADGDPTD